MFCRKTHPEEKEMAYRTEEIFKSNESIIKKEVSFYF